MLLKHISTFLVFLLATNFARGKFTCDPIADCSTSSPGDLVPDPEDCLKYFVCSTGGPTPTSFDCPAGQYFSLSNGVCEFGTGCGDNDCSGYNECTAVCPGTANAIPYPGDCTKYYRCNDPGDVVGTCSGDTPYFDGKQCVAEAEECCAVCDPTCVTTFSLVIDPNDCHSYYLCDASLNLIPNTCKDGDYFNPLTTSCEIEKTECSSYCPDGSPNFGTPGTTEIPRSTTTTPPTTTESSTTTPERNCYEGFECPVDEGSYTYCNECTPEYWKCTGGVASIESCSDAFVFDYTVQQCIPEEDCPTFGA